MLPLSYGAKLYDFVFVYYLVALLDEMGIYALVFDIML